MLAIVTGASSGIGFELANELATRGYDLVVASAGPRLTEAVARFRISGVEVIEVSADLATKQGIDEFWRQVVALGRPVDVACLNAGVGVGGLFTETNLDEELNMVALNCSGTVQLAKHVVRHMQKADDGKILFTASIAGEMVAPREAVYAATKAFVLSFAHSLRGTQASQSRRCSLGRLIRTSSAVRAWTARKWAMRANPRASQQTLRNKASRRF